MSIFRSGLVQAVQVRCVKALSAGGQSFQVGEVFELALDMGTLYVLKTAAGQDVLVPKDSFVIAEAPKSSEK